MFLDDLSGDLHSHSEDINYLFYGTIGFQHGGMTDKIIAVEATAPAFFSP